mgnify:CR=1 FL=1
MTEQNNYNNIPEEQEIDIMELLAKLWKSRRLIIKWGIIGAVVGLIAGFSIPKTYRVSAMLAPETQQRVGSGVSSIASMMGVSLDNSMDAIDVEMYPDVVGSTPFLFNLLDLQVQTKDGKIIIYASEAKITEDPIEAEFFGCGGVAEIDDLQNKLIKLARGGFKHHTAICEGNYVCHRHYRY